MAVLISSDGRHAFPLGQTTVIGSDPTCDICLRDPLVSLNHAEIHRTANGEHEIVDLGSRHGTFVFARRISDCLLADGDQITLGTTVFVFGQEQDSSIRSTHVPVDLDADEPSVFKTLLFEANSGFEPEERIHDETLLRRSYEKLRLAHEVSRVIGGENDLSTVLEQVIELTFRIFPADRAAIVLFDSKSGKLVPKVAKHRLGGKDKIRLSRKVIERALEQKAGIVSADAGSDRRFNLSDSVATEGIRSIMCIPMMHAGKAMGIMHIDSLVQDNVFRPEDLDLFSSIGSQAAMAIRNAMLSQRTQEEARTRVQLQRFLPPSLVDQVVSGSLSIGQSGEVREVAILFADIRGFTRMVEKLDPQQVVGMLNQYFEIMLEVLFCHGGTFDKYVGDEVMALFGFPAEMPDASLSAVACALDMMEVMRDYNDVRSLAGHEAVEIGIGIYTGRALCGEIGASHAKQYTAVGNSVNVAARLCAMAGPGQIVIGQATMEHVRDQFEVEPLPPVSVKGVSEELQVYQVSYPESTKVSLVNAASLKPKDVVLPSQEDLPTQANEPDLNTRLHFIPPVVLRSTWMHREDLLDCLNPLSDPPTFFYPVLQGIEMPDLRPGMLVLLELKMNWMRIPMRIHARVRLFHSLSESPSLILEFLKEQRTRFEKLMAIAQGDDVELSPRRYRRWECELPVVVRLHRGLRLNATAINIGKGGAYLLMTEPLPVDTSVELLADFRDGQPSFFTSARVVSMTPVGPEQGIGVEFEFHDLEQMEVLKRKLTWLVGKSHAPKAG